MMKYFLSLGSNIDAEINLDFAQKELKKILTNINVSSSGVLKAIYGLDEEVVIAKIPLTSFESMVITGTSC